MSLGLPGLGRFSEPGLLILITLGNGEKHGYAMMEEIETMHDVRLGPGTLYGAIARLEERGLIEALPEVERRRPYRLTGKGEQVLRDQLLGLQKLTARGLEVLAAR